MKKILVSEAFPLNRLLFILTTISHYEPSAVFFFSPSEVNFIKHSGGDLFDFLNKKFTIVTLSGTNRKIFNKMKFIFSLPIILARLYLLYDAPFKIAHSELSLLFMSDDQKRPSTFQKLRSLYYLREKECEINALNIPNFDLVVLGHKVYASRLLYNFALSSGVKIVLYGSNNFQILSRSSEILPFLLPTAELTKKFEVSSLRERSAAYWERRLLGDIAYSDAREASQIQVRIDVAYPANVVLLHVFKDSPNFSIDSDRVFNDYFDWMRAVLDIIRRSPERWAIRLHPSSGKWGENQMKVIDALDVSSVIDGSRVILDDHLVSNTYILKHCQRIVTFQGSVVLEAVAMGRRPVCVSCFSDVQRFLDLKLQAASIKDLEKYCLSTVEYWFKPPSDLQIQKAKFLIYLKEVVLSFNVLSKVKLRSRGEEASNDLISEMKLFNEELSKFKHIFWEFLNSSDNQIFPVVEGYE
ncbi:MAG: hypothetical protein A0129_15045 [Limnobacter sp. CACIAM 66H1]|uniref:hypothetical protein n=1 Tax=Limnobacter sp. CACIAM 66H1 TaxID=1813033 RepID=UPI0007A909A9|nr:hypothetical protein [Limnobacter sp. CACIAM 66H1]KYP10051.1 MAG: hypothetical protein A0129_15045 [Limnobacter sp. CACIAM 66H1]